MPTSRYRLFMKIARLVVLDRETPAELRAWLSLSEWDRRHYATRVAEKLSRSPSLENA